MSGVHHIFSPEKVRITSNLITGDGALDCFLLQHPLLSLLLAYLKFIVNCPHHWMVLEFKTLDDLGIGHIFAFAESEHDSILVVPRGVLTYWKDIICEKLLTVRLRRATMNNVS